MLLEALQVTEAELESKTQELLEIRAESAQIRAELAKANETIALRRYRHYLDKHAQDHRQPISYDVYLAGHTVRPGYLGDKHYLDKYGLDKCRRYDHYYHELTKALQASDTLSSELSAARLTNDSLGKNLSAARMENASLSSSLQQSRTEHAATKHELSDLRACSKAELKRATDQIESLGKDLAALEVGNSRLKSELEKTLFEKDVLGSNLGNAREELSRAFDARDELRKNCDRLNSELATVRSQLASTSAAWGATQDRAKHLNDTVSLRETQINALRLDVSNAKTENQALRAEVQDLATTIGMAASETARTQNALQAAQTHATVAAGRVGRLHEEVFSARRLAGDQLAKDSAEMQLPLLKARADAAARPESARSRHGAPPSTRSPETQKGQPWLPASAREPRLK